MSKVTVQVQTETTQTLMERMEALTDAIRKRALAIFQSHNGGNASDLDDWLQAERDLVWSPASELVNGEKEFVARIAAPGFEVKDVHVSALPNALIIEGDTTHTHESTNGNVCFCEFSEKSLFRRLDLPEAIDPDKVTASLDNGILQVTACKATAKPMAAAA